MPSGAGRPVVGTPPLALLHQLVQFLGHAGERFNAHVPHTEDMIRADKFRVADTDPCVIAARGDGEGGYVVVLLSLVCGQVPGSLPPSAREAVRLATQARDIAGPINFGSRTP
jgi:hypothetical protein